METYVSSRESPELEARPIQELLTAAELATALKVPISWVYDHSRRRGRQKIPCIKLGKYLRFCWPEVERWLRSLREA